MTVIYFKKLPEIAFVGKVVFVIQMDMYTICGKHLILKRRHAYKPPGNNSMHLTTTCREQW